MSTISLPALTIQAPAPPPDPITMFMRARQLANMGLETQVRQGEIQSQSNANQLQQLQIKEVQRLDLTGPDYFFSPKGQIQLEPKDAMKARGLDSPDIGDCLAMSHSVKVLARKPALPPVLIYPCLSDTARWMH
jgi:hypothetical protein